MPSGAVHTRASLALSMAFVGVSAITGRPVFLECALGAAVGTLVSPDLDLDVGNISIPIIRKRLGRPGAWLWDKFWYHYRVSFKHGRFASHGAIFGTFVRLAYIFYMSAPAIALWSFLAYPLKEAEDYYLILIYNLYLWITILLRPGFFIGLAGADFIHMALDAMTTYRKVKDMNKAVLYLSKTFWIWFAIIVLAAIFILVRL